MTCGYRPAAVEFLILGPLEVTATGETIEINGPKERAALAVLVCQAGQVVSPDRLADALWGDEPPRSWAKAVQNLVLRLRRTLGPDLIETRPGGYVLRAEGAAVDAVRFAELVRSGSTADLAGGLDLWRGPPLPELADWPPAVAEAARLEELRRGAEEDLVERELNDGRHHAVVARLETMVANEPLRERRWGQLMRALYRCGRQADALRAYQRARLALSELGLEPSEELRSIERAVSTHDASLVTIANHALPTGVVSFLLTDIDGSAALWERAPSEMAAALDRHDHVIADAVSAAGGLVLKARGEGDSSFSVFSKTTAAVAAAIAARDALATEKWPAGIELDVRMAIHMGEAVERDGDYFGPTVNRAARIRGVAQGGQILLSETVANLVRDDLPGRFDLAELGEQALRGLARPERVFTLVPSGAMSSAAATVVARSCPYMGLLPFQPEDERIFFGRDELIRDLAARLGRDQFVAVVGASGSGKSSLLRAGLIAHLRTSSDAGADPPIVLVTPTARPLAALAAGLAPLCDVSAGALRRELASDAGALDLAMRQAVVRHGGAVGTVLVDQFEEAFTLCHDESERRAFIDALVDAASTEDGVTRVVVALRGDFFGHCAAHEGLARLLESRTVLVGTMDADGLRSAIDGPARLAGLTLEPGLVDLILRDVTGEPGGLPLLSHALLELWSRREGRMLTVAGYHDSGGVTGAIGRTADAVYAALDTDQQDEARRIFLRLTELGEGTEDTRRRATLEELGKAGSTETSVLDTLAAARLVTVSDDGVEVAHEALIREWPRLRGWLDEDREGLRVWRHLSHAAREWVERSRDESELYRGSRLAAVLDWREDGHRDELTALENEFIDAADELHQVEAREEEARVRARERNYRTLRVLLVGTGVALVIAMIAALLALNQRNSANSARSRADAAAETATVVGLTTAARTLPASQTELALLLGVEAHRTGASTETEGALQAALVRAPSGLDDLIHLDGNTVLPAVTSDGRDAIVPLENDLEEIDLTTHEVKRHFAGGSGLLANLSSDERLVVSGASGSRGLQVWDVASGDPTGSPFASGTVYGFFDPTDSRRIFAVRFDPANAQAQVEVWAANDSGGRTQVGAPMPFTTQPDSNPFALVSRDGRFLATGSGAGGSTIVWDLAAASPRFTLAGAPATFLQDRNQIAMADGEVVRFYDLDSGEEQGAPLTGFTLAVGAAASSRDGTRLAVVDADHGVRVFDIAARQQLGPVLALDATDFAAGFLPDGRVVTAASDRLGVWRVDARVAPMAIVVGDHAGPFGQTPVVGQFVPGGDDVITEAIYYGREVERWSGSTATRSGDLPPDARAYSSTNADGGLLAGPIVEKAEVGIWDLRGGSRLATIPTGGLAQQALWSSSSVMLVTGSDPGISLYDVADPAAPRFVGAVHPPADPPGTSLSMSFSDDGRLFVVVDYPNSRVTVYDTASLRQLWTKERTALTDAAFSPDGRLLAVNSGQSISLFDAKTGDARRSFAIPGAGSIGIAWVRGGRVIATSSELSESALGRGAGAAVQLWDAVSLEPLGAPMALGVVGNFYLSRNGDGSKLVAGTTQGNAVVFDLDVAHWEQLACRIAGRNLTQAEWERYLPNQPYRVTCPQWPAGS